MFVGETQAILIQIAKVLVHGGRYRPKEVYRSHRTPRVTPTLLEVLYWNKDVPTRLANKRI